MQIFDYKDNCCGCYACRDVCPKKAISMNSDEEGFLYPEIDHDLCIDCGLCQKVCPFKSKPEMPEFNQKVFGLKHKDEGIRFKSTSGGAFTAISDFMLNEDGKIYGAVFNENFEVIHTSAENFDDRNKMLGSKYVQSNLSDIYKQIRKDLQQGKKVLFTGTPCQNSAVRLYLQTLRTNTENLVTCDVACHGVPSPMVWRDYVSLKNKDNSIDKINFRNKDNGWHDFNMKIEYKNGDRYSKNMKIDPYYILFFDHHILRPSCHKCPYTNYNRPSDLTLADFWGVEQDKKYDDDKGITMVLSNTDKGQNILNKISENVNIEERTKEEAYQPIFEYPSHKSPNRDEFWKDYINNGPEFAFNKYGRLSFVSKCVKFVAVPLAKKLGLYQLAIKIVFKLKNR